MAPTQVVAATEQPSNTYHKRGGIGQYKDFASSKIDHEKELKGTDTHAAASFPKYLPVWYVVHHIGHNFADKVLGITKMENSTLPFASWSYHRPIEVLL